MPIPTYCRYFVEIPYRDHFTLNEVSTIRRGHGPRDQDEKWVFSFESPNIVVRRSGVGIPTFLVRLSFEPSGEAEVQAAYLDPEFAESSWWRETFSLLIPWLIRAKLLGQETPQPRIPPEPAT